MFSPHFIRYHMIMCYILISEQSLLKSHIEPDVAQIAECTCEVMKVFLSPRCSRCPWRWAAAAVQPPATHLALWCRCASPALRPRCWTVLISREKTAGSVTSPSTSRDMCSKPTAASWPPPRPTSTTRCAVMSLSGNRLQSIKATWRLFMYHTLFRGVL